MCRTYVCTYVHGLKYVLWFLCTPLQNVTALKQLMEEVATLKAEREVVVKELKDPVADISEWLVSGNGFGTMSHLASSSVCMCGWVGGEGGLYQQITP